VHLLLCIFLLNQEIILDRVFVFHALLDFCEHHKFLLGLPIL
jgi:hypothetical protein